MSHKTTILIVEDEESILKFIATALTANGYKVIKSRLGKDAISLITSHCPDLVILDLGLPDLDGLEVLKSVREWSNLPVLVVSARNEEAEKVKALDSGADDYITKPFGTSELLARIRAALRHYKSSESQKNDSSFQTGGLKIDFARHEVMVDGEKLHLTQIEYKLVCLLAKSVGKVLTYESIMTEIWGPYMAKDNQILRVNMANIRRKIEENPADPKYIFTEVGVGYRMADSEEEKR